MQELNSQSEKFQAETYVAKNVGWVEDEVDMTI